MSRELFVCVHGHFYQPPRENAWLEAIEVQDSAAPYHDWNDRINTECYEANGSSRILNAANKIVRIVNNYSRMSFNFGPTLLGWMESAAPQSYRRVLDADRISRTRFGGHGSAIAQVYNHIILPLAATQDRIRQIRWGIADFEHRFGRQPEGMWLAETAVDLESLDLLAQHGIQFTILAPHQCARVRPICTEDDPEAPAWHETPNATVDPTQPYLVRTREGRSIAVFFYDGPASRAVAFEGLLNDGKNFARRLLAIHRDNGRVGQLAHIATDGESYGHHHRHGDMALAYAQHWLEENSEARLTNYGQFLELFPPAYEAEIYEDTSWSCSHGIERWRSDCGCNSGGHPGWRQKWRAPLREALDWLRDAVRPLCEQAAAALFTDWQAACNEYIRVLLNRNTDNVRAFLHQHGRSTMGAEEQTRALKLLEIDRHIQLMYTSCGWFFDDISGIETVQIISYAGRVLQLAEQLFQAPGAALQPEFLARLEAAPSNDPESGNGAAIYKRQVVPQQIGLEQVGADYAVLSVFEAQTEEARLYCYDVRRRSCEVLSSGRGRIALGQAEVCSRITLECESVDFAVLHLGDQNLSAAVRRSAGPGQDSFHSFEEEIRTAIVHADLPEVMRLFVREFGTAGYSLSSLFRDEQRRILQIILDSTLAEMERNLRTIYQNHMSLLHYLSLSGMPKPQALMLAAQFSLNADIGQVLVKEPFDSVRLQELLAQVRTDAIPLDTTLLSYLASQRIRRAMRALQQSGTLKVLETTVTIVEMLRAMPFEVQFWDAQNIWHSMLGSSPRNGDTEAQWARRFRQLGMLLDLEVDTVTVEN